jgi:hypothetical protein
MKSVHDPFQIAAAASRVHSLPMPQIGVIVNERPPPSRQRGSPIAGF